MSPLVGVLIGGGALLFAATASAANRKAPKGGGGSMTNAQHAFEAAVGVLGLDPAQAKFLSLVAHGESDYHASAHNDSPGETAASVAAWENNAKLAADLAATGYPKGAWCIGSGGYGGRLVPYYGRDMLAAGLHAEAVPHGVFNPATSIVSTVIVCSRLQALQGWRVNPTVGNLRIGFWGSAKMGPNPDPDRIAKYRRHAVEIGLPESFIDAPIARFPGEQQGASMLATLRAHGVKG